MINFLFFHVQTFNLIFAVSGLLLLGVTAALVFDYFSGGQKLYKKYLAQYVWPIIPVVTFGGVAITLLYSEVYGFVPCSLCWLQRIALYPQALMTILAFKMKDAVFFPLYGIVLSGFGLAVAIYQYIYQMVPTEVRDSGFAPCLADGSGDCTLKVIEVFGFVTFPFLAAVMFVFLIVLYLHLYKNNSN